MKTWALTFALALALIAAAGLWWAGTAVAQPAQDSSTGVSPVQTQPTSQAQGPVAPEKQAAGETPVVPKQPEKLPPGTYRIQFNRPVAVGQEFRCTYSGQESQDQTTTLPNQPPQSEKTGLAYELAGLKKITQVDGKGRPTAVEFTVDACVKVEGDKRTDVLPKGAIVVVAMEKGQKVIRSKDPTAALAADAVSIFQNAVNVQSDEMDLDEAFGANQPRKAGESWPVNSEYLAKSISKIMGMEQPMKKEDVVGSVRLAGVKKVAGIECLNLRLDVLVGGFVPPVPQAKVEKSEMRMNMTGNLPVDPAMPMLGGSQAMSMAMTMTAPSEGSEMKMQMDMKQTRTSQEIPK